MSTSGGRIPCLDGLRAISIGAVIFAHLAGTGGFLPAAPIQPLNLGELGVRVFFVISGFLITSLLLAEEARTGTISLRGFYVRRIYRIFPAFYVFLAVVAILDQLSPTLLPGDLLAAATYTMNHHAPHAWWVGHLWSLSVEEQFYLLWPAALLALGPRRGIVLAAAVMVLSPLIRSSLWFGWPVDWPAARENIGAGFPTIADSLATGCVLAGIRPRLDQTPAYLRALAAPAFVLVPLAAVGMNLLSGSPRIHYTVGHTVINVALALTIDRVIRWPHDRVGRVLEHPFLVWVGVMSYSLYLWQQLFLDRASSGWAQSFPVNLALTVACAAVSYYAIERPVLQYRQRRALTRARSTRSPPAPATR